MGLESWGKKLMKVGLVGGASAAAIGVAEFRKEQDHKKTEAVAEATVPDSETPLVFDPESGVAPHEAKPPTLTINAEYPNTSIPHDAPELSDSRNQHILNEADQAPLTQ